jgi:hypothetical protein
MHIYTTENLEPLDVSRFLHYIQLATHPRHTDREITTSRSSSIMSVQFRCKHHNTTWT